MGTILRDLYVNLRKEHYDQDMVLHHSDVYYIRAALMADHWTIMDGAVPQDVKDAVAIMPLQELGDLLREEGLLKYYEYGIPRWYARKWFREGLTRKQAVAFAQSIQRRHG